MCFGKFAGSNGGIILTGYHPPFARATNFFRQNPRPGDSFLVQNVGPRAEKRNKIPTPRHDLPSSNAKISVKKELNSIRVVSFQIFHNYPFDNFLLS